MIPFCRTVDEGKRVITAMAAYGLRQHERGLDIYAICDVPSNAVLADAFLRVFDGFSIGSNDLTQLTLGLDRDSGRVAHLFDEREEAVRWLIAAPSTPHVGSASQSASAVKRRPTIRSSRSGS
jgi:pyruvate, water dikinase